MRYAGLGLLFGLALAVNLSARAADAHAMPRIQMETTLGDIVLELHHDKAPNTVDNFLRYVEDGFYDGTIFHRVIENFMIQGGGFTSELERRDPRSPIDNEADNGLKNLRGTIAMARTSDPHSATAQFFINVEDNPFLDHSGKNRRGWGYCVFGRVVDGMDTVDKIRRTPTSGKGPFRSDVPKPTIEIIKARVVSSPAPTEE